MRRFKFLILLLALSLMTLCFQSCNLTGSYDKRLYDENGNYITDSRKSCGLFFAKNGDFEADEIIDIASAREFCKTTSYKYFGDIVFNETGPDSGYAYMVKCCSRNY